MSEINLQLVREFFELNRFSVLTHWRHGDERAKASEDASLLFVEHLRGDEGGRAPFLLSGASIQSVQRAVVEVRAWHGDQSGPVGYRVQSDSGPRGLARGGGPGARGVWWRRFHDNSGDFGVARIRRSPRPRSNCFRSWALATSSNSARSWPPWRLN